MLDAMELLKLAALIAIVVIVTWVMYAFEVGLLRPSTLRSMRAAKQADPDIRQIRKVSKEGPNIVSRNQYQYWQEMGWKLSEEKKLLTGFYRTRKGSFQGEIKNPFSASAEYFIIDPPEEVLTGTHKRCFTDRGRNRFSIHWNIIPSDVNVGINGIEKLIQDSLL